MGTLTAHNAVAGSRSERAIIYHKRDVSGTSDVDGTTASINLLALNPPDMSDRNYEAIIEGCVW